MCRSLIQKNSLKKIKRDPESGLTLIEIMVSIAIIALITGLSVGFFHESSDARLERVVNELSGTIRYLYNESTIQKRPYRLLFDFEQRTIDIESTSGSFAVTDSPEGILPSDKLEQEQKKTDDSTAESSPNEEKVSFSKVTSFLSKPIQLPEGVKIKDIFVKHVTEKIESGRVAIYFFPNGWVEKAVINFCDEAEQDCYSIETFSITGKTKIRSGYFDYRPEEKREQ